MKERGHKACLTIPKSTFKVFEDNEGAMELARFTKMRPRTKYANKMHHHFRYYVSSGDVEIFCIETKVHIGDTTTKTLPKEKFIKLLLKLMCF